MSPDIPEPTPPQTILPKEEARSLDATRNRRLRGATLLAGRKSAQTLGSSLIGTGTPVTGSMG